MRSPASFWKTKTLEQMTAAEWESLCDGCGRCCLHKLRTEDTDEILYTNVACRLLDTDSCACSDYQHRRRKVPDCVQLTPAALSEIDWLPPSCGSHGGIRWSRGVPTACTRQESPCKAAPSASAWPALSSTTWWTGPDASRAGHAPQDRIRRSRR